MGHVIKGPAERSALASLSFHFSGTPSLAELPDAVLVDVDKSSVQSALQLLNRSVPGVFRAAPRQPPGLTRAGRLPANHASLSPGLSFRYKLRRPIVFSDASSQFATAAAWGCAAPTGGKRHAFPASQRQGGRKERPTARHPPARISPPAQWATGGQTHASRSWAGAASCRLRRPDRLLAAQVGWEPGLPRRGLLCALRPRGGRSPPLRPRSLASAACWLWRAAAASGDGAFRRLRYGLGVAEGEVEIPSGAAAPGRSCRLRAWRCRA
jgi:hypothetical protein